MNLEKWYIGKSPTVFIVSCNGKLKVEAVSKKTQIIESV
jgi:hypothetical protein